MKKYFQQFEAANENCAIAYGGDGTLLDIARANGFKKTVFPIRNYGLCNEHKQAFEALFMEDNTCNSLKLTTHMLLNARFDGKFDIAAAEVTVKNKDFTSCMRFDLLVNGNCYMENVICDGIIFATSLGSHGYFKSVTRTIFKSGIGVGLIAPTYGLNNLVLGATDKIAMRLVRSTDIVLTADKILHDCISLAANSLIEISCDPINRLNLLGYDMFCCPKCRRNRNSTVINDQYLG